MISQVKALDQLNLKDKAILLKQIQFGANAAKIVTLVTSDNAENVLHLSNLYFKIFTFP